jgi:hypothetical protein
VDQRRRIKSLHTNNILKHKTRKFNYKGKKKKTIPLYPGNYVKEERSYTNRKVV